MERQEDERTLAFVVCSRGGQMVDATAVAEFDSTQNALAYTLLMKTRALRTGLERSLISALKGCPWLTNGEVGFEVKREGGDWAVRVASGQLSEFLAVFHHRDEADDLVTLLQSARAFRLWTAIGGGATA